MKTTLNKIREYSPCKEGWEKLLNYLGKTKADDEELSLLTILDSNNLDDTLWCFKSVDGYEYEMRLFARMCAIRHVEKIKHYTSEDAYVIILKWLETGDENKISAARSAARSAWSSARSAESSAWSSAESAESARSAAESARSAAESAAESSAWSAAWSARSAARSAASEEKEVQTQILRNILESINEQS